MWDYEIAEKAISDLRARAEQARTGGHFGLSMKLESMAMQLGRDSRQAIREAEVKRVESYRKRSHENDILGW